MKPLLQVTNEGLYCEAGGFHIDPWRAVDRALITHAHADHARWGSRHYLCASPGKGVLRVRMGPEANIESIPYGEKRSINGVTVSFHPAGHLLGSAQIRLEHKGEVWVVSGDYKTEADQTCETFEPVRCHTFITESTFGLPIYRWSPQREIFAQINAWWATNQEEGKNSILFSYALGKAQRLLAGVDAQLGPILLHGAIEKLIPPYLEAGVKLPHTLPASVENAKLHKGKALIIAPPSAGGSPWIRKFAPYSTGFASGWMRVRGARRRRALDRGFILSDHADWAGLLGAIEATEAERILVTHGPSNAIVRYLNEQGKSADRLETRFLGEEGGDDPAESGSEVS